jgi:hypothetical protein
MPGDCIATFPHTSGQPGKIGRAERRRLRHLRPHNRQLHDIRLILQQCVINRSPAVHAKLGHRTLRVAPHRIRKISNLQRNTLNCGPRNMPGRGPAGYSYNCSASIRVPMRRTKSSERRYNVNAAIVSNRPCKCFNFRRRFDDSEPIAKPRNDGAADKHSTFERVLKPAIHLPGHCGKQPILRVDRFAAGVHQHEAAGAIRVFREARLETRLSEERRLLITRRTGNLHTRKLGHRLHIAVNFTRRANFREHGTWHAEAG